MAFRTWSHYRALYGGKYLEALLSRNLITPVASKQMDEIYASGLPHLAPGKHLLNFGTDSEEAMLLSKSNGKLIAQAFELPEMEVEITRAVQQVESAVNGAAKGGSEEVDGKVTMLSLRAEKS